MRYSFVLVIIGLCICSWLFTGCASSRFIKPLEKKQTAITANIGGPFVQYSGMGIPAPLTSVAVGHGFTKDLTCFAGLHTTALLFGVVQTDIGAVKELMKQKRFRPGVSVSPVANLMLDKWEHKFSFFPQIDAHAYWNYLKKPHYAYVGFSNWFDLHSKLTNGEPQTYHWMPVIELGNTFVHHKWSYAVELKYIAFNKRNISIVNYTGIGNPDNSTGIGQRGALGIYFGVTRTF